ncbi:helix-turn-helix transcriptional regulator [Miltoncostaea marina]|uniref:helix-turn-helix transcriptional regulator n=1 Tax=Miltoncostaea marina TaxID=2843215 RepID=UPI001C3D40E8|nr:helix-turn-helix transcriptional regulator [Miltoncostaea marina]
MNCTDPLVACDGRSRVVLWNAAAAALTGLAEHDVTGSPCWTALDAICADGTRFCRPGCERGRLACTGCPPPAQEAWVRTAEGPRRAVRLAMLSLDDAIPARFAVLIQPLDAPARPAGDPGDVRLTPRQHEVLMLMAEGLTVRSVAARLGLSEATVRNYVRRILIELRSHSQREAVAAARGLGLV